jgi:methylmalonyl-CoA mutase N-terminal domain/subunit
MKPQTRKHRKIGTLPASGGVPIFLRKWEAEVLGPALKKAPERQKEFETVSHIPLNRVYTPSDLGKIGTLPASGGVPIFPDSVPTPWNYEEQLGLPGAFPFTRGVQPTMYRTQFWTMRQYAGFGSAEDTNKRYHYLLEQGQTGLSVAFDLPTQMGYDSDHPLAQGEVGKVGVAISSLADLEALFAGIPLDKVSTSMTINATAGILLAMYCVLAEKQEKIGTLPASGGVPIFQRLRGTIQNDILKEYIARGAYIFPPRPSLRLVTDIIAWCARNAPKWNTISVSGYHIREAGATAVQEVAFTLADGLEYVKAATAAGLAIGQFAPRLSFFFAAHSNLLEEAAKFRAARRLWARLLRQRWNASDESSRLRFHTQTGGVTLTAQQPDNNVIRVAYQALAAVLGGTQSLHTNSRDEALCLPTQQSALIALRTQQILALETGVADTVDPLAGSYLIESLTDEIERQAAQLIRKIDDMGGVLIAIERGFLQDEIADSAYRFQQELERNERLVVGVNYKTDRTDKTNGDGGMRLLAEPRGKKPLVDPELGERRQEELARYRARREPNRVQATLAELRRAAATADNLMPGILEAVRAEATVGEISDALRDVFGEHDAPGGLNTKTPRH